MIKKSILFILLAIVVLCSCDESEKADEKKIEISDESELVQTAYADEQNTGGGFTLLAQESWTANISENTRAGVSWLRLLVNGREAYSGGAGAFSLTIGLDPNYTGQKRMATITLTCGDEAVRISVTQEGTNEEGEVPVDPDVPIDPEPIDPEPDLTLEEEFLLSNSKYYKHIVTQEEWDQMTEYNDVDKYRVQSHTGFVETSVSKHTHKEYQIYEILDFEYTTMEFVDYVKTFPNIGNPGSVFRINSQYTIDNLPTVIQTGIEALEGYYRIIDGSLKQSAYIQTSTRDVATRFIFTNYAGDHSLYYFIHGGDFRGIKDEIHPIHIYRVYKYKYDRVYILGSYEVTYR